MIPDCQACFNFSGHQSCPSRWRQIAVGNPVQRRERFRVSRGVRRSQWRSQCHRQGKLTLIKIHFFSLRGKERKKENTDLVFFFSFFSPQPLKKTPDLSRISGMKGKEERVTWYQLLWLFGPFPPHAVKITFQVNACATAIHRIRRPEITLLSFVIWAFQ